MPERVYPKRLILVHKFDKDQRFELEVINEFNESCMVTTWGQLGYVKEELLLED